MLVLKSSLLSCIEMQLGDSLGIEGIDGVGDFGKHPRGRHLQVAPRYGGLVFTMVIHPLPMYIISAKK